MTTKADAIGIEELTNEAYETIQPQHEALTF